MNRKEALVKKFLEARGWPIAVRHTTILEVLGTDRWLANSDRVMKALGYDARHYKFFPFKGRWMDENGKHYCLYVNEKKTNWGIEDIREVLDERFLAAYDKWKSKKRGRNRTAA